MEQIQENEQWKLNGNCEKCRRNNYCSTPCTHYNRRIRAEFKGLVADTMNKMTGGVMREAIDKTVIGNYKSLKSIPDGCPTKVKVKFKGSDKWIEYKR